jgi:hypothetical protein
MISKLLLSAIALAAIGTTAQAQVPGEALVTAQAEIQVVPSASVRLEPKITPEAFGALISCQSVYMGGLGDDAVAGCVTAQSVKGASE